MRANYQKKTKKLNTKWILEGSNNNITIKAWTCSATPKDLTFNAYTYYAYDYDYIVLLKSQFPKQCMHA